MNLYLISQCVKDDCDAFDEAVVAARNEEDARNTHPLSEGASESTRKATWAPVENVNVKLIGVAVEGTEPGVICASFNAG